MAKTAIQTVSVDLEPIDRLEEKLKQFVKLIERMKAEQARTAEDNTRLTRELDSLRSRLSAGDSAAAEVSALRQERDVIRARVGEMLHQLEALSL
jgi:regulator of replication initiation timing